MNKTFSIKAALRHGWEVFKSNRRTLIAATFIMMVAEALRDSDKRGQWREFNLSSFIIWVAVFIAAVIIRVGWIKLILKLEDEEPVTVRELFMHSKLFLKYLWAMVLYVVGAAIGFVLLIIPGFYILVTYGFAPVIAIDEYVTVKEAFRRSARMTKGVKWKLFGFLLILVIFNILGAIPLLLGLFITVPVSSIAYIRVYRLMALVTEEPKITA